ncbi:putative ADP-ribosylation factor-binding protein C25H2.16c [Golovinomyces cichoracearum]|uniref:Putative ADP-ribosylation factor-binding protein C25H2.16c n=1 Tax=Golovinomyces cichoracearum TaxID=62708 RepID=A0A420HV17_9PEZI|nr:putative ADP-ribosylation factor-binding protein C25H2.16c [Golovinomyces cichoracearum]
MEAASARMAGRERSSAAGDFGSTPLQRYIKQACSLENLEPNLALNLEIADLINLKKGNAPREAAMTIVSHINHRNPNVSLLALDLLDICVKNCGYPFQLQISMKEFLNELVRRFPERPPIRPTRVQLRILEAIEEWRGTICQTSRYKDDLGYIRDMHRLLSYKGYVFPEVKREAAAVLNPSDALKSAEEMEEEERAAQSAKLQELIRRGGPEDLQEANRLMKIMAGYDTRQKTDYRAKAAEEVGKVQQKARLLEERLETFKVGDTMVEGDVFEELAAALQSAHPKIQKMCEEESEDHEAVAKLFEINDSINRTVERYKLMKKGEIEAASRIAKGTLGTSTGVNSQNELSLIDLDGDESDGNGSSINAPTRQKFGLEDDLLELSMGSDNEHSGGVISLGVGTTSSQLITHFHLNRELTVLDIPRSSSTIHASSYNSDLENLPTNSPIPLNSTSHNKLLSTFGSPHTIPSPAPPQTSLYPQAQESRQNKAFAATSLPLSNQTATSTLKSFSYLPETPSLFDFANQKAPASSIPAVSSDDDDWAFASALPEGLPSSRTLQICQSALIISLHATRLPYSSNEITLSLSFSNVTNEVISDLTFMAAVTKSYNLKLQPQSGRLLQPNEHNGVTQVITLMGVEPGKCDAVRLRWKVSYRLGAKPVSEQGEVTPLGIA